MLRARKTLWQCLLVLSALLMLPASAAMAQEGLMMPPSGSAVAPVEGRAVTSVGPGDLLHITVFGQADLTSQVTVTEDGEITVPLLGVLRVANQAPSQIARHIERGMRDGGFLRDPKVSVEVMRVRSRVASVLGEVQRPGRYPIEGSLSLLELLALAGGLKDSADETVVLMRRDELAEGGRQRLEVPVGNRRVPGRQVRDLELQPGDVVYVPQTQQFFIYGEVGQPGAYPVEAGVNVMRALSLAGGINPRGSERRISIKRTDPDTGESTSVRVQLTDPVRPGDVIYVDERFF